MRDNAPNTLDSFASLQNQPPEVFNRLGLIYAGYRVFLSLFLFIIFVATSASPIQGSNLSSILINVILFYCIASLLQYITLRQWVSRQKLLFILIFAVDIFVFTGLLYSNGGPSIQLSMLYLVVVMAASILLPRSHAWVIALLAVITVVYQQFYFAIFKQASVGNISDALLLSLSFLGVSMLGQFATQRMQTAEQTAWLNAREVEKLQGLSQRIIESMKSGILVINQQGMIIFINHAAQLLLKSFYARTGNLLPKVSSILTAHIQENLALGKTESFFMPNTDPLITDGLKLNFVRLNITANEPFILIILEDLAQTYQAAQQLKLASLGRLTAGIAHEIRNPLGAISQAGELLAESVHSEEDLVLIEMIKKQSVRINRIIEDILQLTRDNKSEQTQINLTQWLPQIVNELLPEATPHLHFHFQTDATVFFDINQLQQVLTNLLSNALYHAQKASKKPRIDIIIGKQFHGQYHLDIIDSGAGISATVKKSLFEPFFTTENMGTGLGLYLSRAYCEANGASLSNIPTPKGACFRIVFARRLKA